MKLLFIHNSYGHYSGEEAVVEAQMRVLKEAGHTVELYSRSSRELEKMRFGSARAFFTALYNRRSIREIRKKLDEFRPDIVHIHNLYPLISPSILPEIKKRGIPVVMTVHNYRLLCPSGLLFTRNEICNSCLSGFKEINCLINNCERSAFKSTGYALRNYYSRKRKFYHNNIDLFLCLTEFQKELLENNGFDPAKMKVVPNFMETISRNDNNNERSFAGFAGRISISKGAHLLFQAAEQLREISFKMAGSVDKELVEKYVIPNNVQLTGQLKGQEMEKFYNSLKYLVVPSLWYEGFPMVVLEAMKHAIPVVAPRHGGFPEIIEDGVNGLLFEPGNATDLAEKIRFLEENPEKARGMGELGFQRAKVEYSGERFLINYKLQITNY